MKILVVNCGSSSLKYQLIDMEDESVIAKGNYQRIGEMAAVLIHKVNGQTYTIEKPAMNHTDALEVILEQFVNSEYGVISSLKEIDAVGHRIVHGGELFDQSVIVDEDVIAKIDQCAELAPLHNPAAILGIRACQEKMPGVPMVTTFDTAFHQTMPELSYLFPIPYEYYEKYRIRKYGAHGTSHEFVSKVAAQMEGKPVEDLKMVTCHLGQGASITAIKDGKCLDTSMGLSPLGGIPMVTRSGDLDPSVVTAMMEKENLTPKQANEILNKKSGMSGISTLDPDYRYIQTEAMEHDNHRAQIAMELFKLSAAQFIAKYAVRMGGLDVIVFTAGIGENQAIARKAICDYLKFMGVEIDEEANEVRGEERLITKPGSKIRAYVIPTNEELVIARDTKRLVEALK